MKTVFGKFAPTWIRRLGYAAALLGLSILFGANPAAAQDFPVDLAMKFCASKQKDSTVMAINDFGTGICAWGYPTIGDAKQGALSKCTGYVPKSMRQKVKCHVVWENGKITDPKLVEIMRKPYRMPVTIEINDGGEKGKQGAPGYMIFGPAPDKLSRTATIHLADGQKICSGIARMRQLKLEFDFAAKCFDGKTLKGKAKVIGLREIGGLQRLALDLMIRQNPGYIRVVAE
jgi:hypothetical protein